MFSEPNIEVDFSFTVISNVAITIQKFVEMVGTKIVGNAFKLIFSKCILMLLRKTLA